MISDFVVKLVARREEIYSKAKEKISKAQDKQNKYYKLRKLANDMEEITFSVNQKVLLYNTRKQTRKGDKLAKNWTGPHIITEMVGRKNVYLDNKKVKRNIKPLKPQGFDDNEKNDEKHDQLKVSAGDVKVAGKTKNDTENKDAEAGKATNKNLKKEGWGNGGSVKTPMQF